MCGGRFHYTSWHAESPGAGATYVVDDLSLAEVDEAKRLAMSTENCCCSNRFDGIEKGP